MCQARRSSRSIMDIYGHERAPIKAPALMGRGGAAEGASFRDASRKARRSTACADETKHGAILPGKNPRFLFVISINYNADSVSFQARAVFPFPCGWDAWHEAAASNLRRMKIRATPNGAARILANNADSDTNAPRGSRWGAFALGGVHLDKQEFVTWKD